MRAICRTLVELATAVFLWPLRALAARPAMQPVHRSVRLDGEASDGRDIHIVLPLADLYGGVVLGSERGDPGLVIVGERVELRHVFLQVKGGALYVRDEGSASGSSLNARMLQPRRHEVAAHGDWLCLGGTVLRLTFH